MTLTAETISIQWAPSADEIPDTLWDACFPPPLEGYWRYHALERCGIDDQFSFAYAVIEKSGRRVGIAPTFIMDLPIDLVAPPLIASLLKKTDMVFPGLRYQRTLFVGSPCADEGTVGLVSGCSLAEVGPALQRSLEMRARVEQVSMIVWKDFRDGSEQDIETLCKTCGLFRLISYPGTRLPLKVDGFKQYLEKRVYPTFPKGKWLIFKGLLTSIYQRISRGC
jgi:uncharacterized protein